MDAEKVLNNAGLRVTKQRITVLKLLLSKKEPMSHGEISQLLSVPMDRVTLYRTLGSLHKHSIVHSVKGLDGIERFCIHSTDTTGCPGDHLHFLCLECGKMFCLTEQKMQRVTVPDGFKVYGKQFVVYGSCPSCLNKEEASTVK